MTDPTRNPPRKKGGPRKPKPEPGTALEIPPAYITDPIIAVKVKTMAMVGTPRADMSLILGISVDMIDRHYRDAWEEGYASGNVQLRQSGFQQALGRAAEYDPVTKKLLREEIPPNVSMAIFLHKTRLGMKETVVREHKLADETAPPGATMPTFDLGLLTNAEVAVFKHVRREMPKRLARQAQGLDPFGDEPGSPVIEQAPDAGPKKPGRDRKRGGADSGKPG